MRRIVLLGIALIALTGCYEPLQQPDSNITVFPATYLGPNDQVHVSASALFPDAAHPPAIYQYVLTDDGSALRAPVGGPASFSQWDVAGGTAEGDFVVHQHVTFGGEEHDCSIDVFCAVVVIQTGSDGATYRHGWRIHFDD